MEPLANPNQPDERRFSLAVVDRFDQIPDVLGKTSRHFALMTAMDSVEVGASMETAIENLLATGLAYFSAWGEDCERVHDAVDEIYIDTGRFDREPSGVDVLMTTWHSGETLEEVLWGLVHATFPAGRYAEDCIDFVIAASPKYASQVRSQWPNVFT